MIAFFALHQLGYGDIMLPIDACQDDDGQARAEFEMGEVLSHAPINPYDGRVYYDAVSCYNQYGVRVKLFATNKKWVRAGEYVTISAYDN